MGGRREEGGEEREERERGERRKKERGERRRGRVETLAIIQDESDESKLSHT